MYSPHKLRNECNKLEHGKARASGLREAIRQADENKDVPFQIYFRKELCDEEDSYGNPLVKLAVFPEMLAIADKNPDAPTTPYNTYFSNSMACVLWTYKWFLESCEDFYQISLEDCERFFEDFKQRSLAFGYQLRVYYKKMYSFYHSFDDPRAKQYFHLFEQSPRDENSDCAACDQIEIVDYYLENGDFEQAKEKAVDLESRKLQCGGAPRRSWIRLKRAYMYYYLEHKGYEQAAEMIRLIKINTTREKEFDMSDDELVCYSYLDIAKALKIYKSNWKGWMEECIPWNSLDIAKNVCIFFKKLAESRKKQTIKIAYDATFPLYREDNTYPISELYDFYYQYAADLAQKFDKRSGTDSRMNELKTAIAKA